MTKLLPLTAVLAVLGLAPAPPGKFTFVNLQPHVNQKFTDNFGSGRDGNDLVAVWRVTQESIHRARTGAGPTLIECCTWRWHAETDGPSGNGGPPPNKSNHVRWQHDPLHHMEHYMKKRNLWNQAWVTGLADDYRRILQLAVKSAGGGLRSS